MYPHTNMLKGLPKIFLKLSCMEGDLWGRCHLSIPEFCQELQIIKTNQFGDLYYTLLLSRKLQQSHDKVQEISIESTDVKNVQLVLTIHA